MSISMRDFDSAGLGDHLRVGPQYVLPADRGMPIVERGPHGAPLSKPDPSRPLRFWSERRITQEWTPKQRVTGVMGMGAGRPEASDDVKKSLSEQARTLASNSKGVSPETASSIISSANALQAQLDSYQPWKQESALRTFAMIATFGAASLVMGGGYDESQTIRENLQIARNNAAIVMGSRDASWQPVSPAVEVSVARETLRELPGAVRERYNELQSEFPWGKVAAGLAIAAGAYGVGKALGGRRIF